MSEDKNKTPLYYPPQNAYRVVRGARSDSRGRHYREIRNTLPDVCGSIPTGGSDEPAATGASGGGRPKPGEPLQPANSDGKRGVERS